MGGETRFDDHLMETEATTPARVKFTESSPERIAALRLEQAASDLLAACKVVTAFLDKLEQDNPELKRFRLPFHAPLRAVLDPAIRKAEGR